MVKIKLFNSLLKLSLPKKSNKIEGNCRKCNGPIFNLDSHFGMRQLCISCFEAYEEGLSTGSEDIIDNNYGYTWYSKKDISKALTIEMMNEGYSSKYDRILKAYRIYKRDLKKSKSFWDF